MAKEKKKKKLSIYDEYYLKDNARNMKDSVIISRLLVYGKPYIGAFIFVVIAVLISSFLRTFMLLLFGELINALNGEETKIILFLKNMIGPNPSSMDLVYILILVASLTLIATSVLDLVKGFTLSKIGQKILKKLRSDLFVHIEHLSLKEIDKTPVGTFVTRVMNDTNSISNLFTQVIPNLFSSVMTMIYAIIFMIITSPTLFFIILGVTVLIFVLTLLFRYFSRRQFRRLTYDRSMLNAFVAENLSGMKITQIFNREEAKLKEFDEKSERFRASRAGTILIFAIFRPAIWGLFFASVIMTFGFGSSLVMNGTLLVGNLYNFYQYLWNLFDPIQNIAQMYNVLQNAFASSEKIYTVLDTKSSITFIDDPIKADNFKGEIEFKHVWFKYDEDWIIKDVSFHVLPGETVAFVGPTGGGKTTILSLIERYYDVNEGEILIDGINVKDYDIYSLRKNIGEMLQDVFLFSGTIKNNITLRDDSISDEEVIESSKYVNADKFVSTLENGYNEIVKERGNNYSQGQRQLLSFARTIVHKPKMIILDEATSNIDTETEVLIQDSLEKITSIGTTIMVAHRLSTIQHADNIMFISGGEIVESGTHQELLAKKGRYYDLYKLQFDKQINNI